MSSNVKHIILIALMTVLFVPAMAQETIKTYIDATAMTQEIGVLADSELLPVFKGNVNQYLATHVRYPKTNAEGRVVVQFIVEKDGSITGAKMINTVDPLLAGEALRVVKTMPKWIPAKQNGKPVRVKYTVPVTFKYR